MGILEQLLEPGRLIGLAQVLIQTGVIIVGALFALRLGYLMIQSSFEAAAKGKHVPLSQQRSGTLVALTKSLWRYFLFGVVALMLLPKFGVEIGGLLAAAGIGGLAIGFGAQNLVRDVITGFFIVLEDQFDLGDHVTLANVSGVVEEMSLRVTKVRDFGGELHIIPNGRIDQVTNHMGRSMRISFDVGVAYEENIEEVITVLEELFAELSGELEGLVEGPRVLGVSQLGESSVDLRIMARSLPMKQWGLEREIRKRIKLRFDQREIEIPYPRRFLIVNYPKGVAE